MVEEPHLIRDLQKDLFPFWSSLVLNDHGLVLWGNDSDGGELHAPHFYQHPCSTNFHPLIL